MIDMAHCGAYNEGCPMSTNQSTAECNSLCARVRANLFMTYLYMEKGNYLIMGTIQV